MIGRMQMMSPQDRLPAEIVGGGEKASASAARDLLIVTTLLLVFGLTMLYSTSYGLAGMKYFRMQLIWLTLGSGAAMSVFFLGYRRIAALWPFLAAGVFLLLVATWFSPEVKGAHRWIHVRIPGMGRLGIQPSEFAKVTLAIITAKYCSDHLRTFHELKRLRGGLLHFCALTAPIVLGILYGRDLGTTALVSLMILLMLLAAGLPMRWGLLAVIAGTLIIEYIKHFDPMRRDRLMYFLDPEKAAAAEGYQLWNSFLALGAGGWHGVGFMESRMKAHYLPEAHTDFILSIVGEELGLIAIVAVIIAYGFFCWAGLRISLHANTRLGMLLGFGLTIYITVQALINIAVISGCMPTKGMPAPFISYGGSNMLTCMTAVGLLLSIAQETVTPDYNKRVLAYIRRKWPFARANDANGE